MFVDDDDYEYIINCFDLKIQEPYVHCTPKKKYRGMGLRANSLQKLLMLPEKVGRSIVVDHKDGNEKNNQKDNLRVCSHQENMRNRKKRGIYGNKPTTSKYKGVSWQTAAGCWVSNLVRDRFHVSLGYYSNEIAAASIYNHAARKEHGEFARLNDLGELEMTEEECDKYRIRKNKTSKYKGVSFVENRWVAQICHESKNIRIGSFNDEEQAAIAYDIKAIELKGDKARLNFSKENYK